MFSLKKFLNLVYYTSPFDIFLAKYDQAHPKLSASQRKEKEKYARIYALRDNSPQNDEKESFWKNF